MFLCVCACYMQMHKIHIIQQPDGIIPGELSTPMHMKHMKLSSPLKNNVEMYDHKVMGFILFQFVCTYKKNHKNPRAHNSDDIIKIGILWNESWKLSFFCSAIRDNKTNAGIIFIACTKMYFRAITHYPQTTSSKMQRFRLKY